MALRTSARALGGAFLFISMAGADLLALGLPAAAAVQLGGWRAGSTDDENVQAAASWAAEQMGGDLASVDSARVQSVAGINYQLELTLQDGSRWRVTVNRSPGGDYSMLGDPAQLQAPTGDGSTGDSSDDD